MTPLLLLLSCTTQPVAEVELLSGFTLEWADLSHRVSAMDVALSEDGGAQMGMVGGDWSTGENAADSLLWQLDRTTLTSDRVTSATQWVTLELTAPFEADTTLSFADLADFPAFDGVISGIRVRTDLPQSDDFPEDYNPADGWPLSELTVAIGEAQIGDGVVELPVTAGFVPGPTEERVLDRPQMDAAMPYATIELELGVTLIGHKDEAWVETVSAAEDMPYDPPYSDHEPFTFPLEPGSDTVASAWRSASFRLNEANGHGDYIRAIGLTANQDEASAWLSGSSVLEIAPLSVAFSGEILRLAPRGATIEPRSDSGAAEVGVWDID